MAYQTNGATPTGTQSGPSVEYPYLYMALSRCGWEALKLYFKKAVQGKKVVHGAIIAVQTFGDFLGFNPHLHVLISDGCFHKKGMFSVSPTADTKHWSRYSLIRCLT